LPGDNGDEEEKKVPQEAVYTGTGYHISISEEDMFGSDEDADENVPLLDIM